MSRVSFYNKAIVPAECISNGWNLYKQRFGLFFTISAVTFFLGNFIPLLNFFIFGPLMCGVFVCLLKQMNGERTSFEDWLKGFNNFIPALLLGLLISTPVIVFQILNTTSDILKIFFLGNQEPDVEIIQDGRFTLSGGAVILLAIVFFLILALGLVLKILLFFALQLVAEHNFRTKDAIKLSSIAAWKNLGGLILLLLLELLIVCGGVALCCVGVFFAMPIVYAANAFAYRQVFPKFGTVLQNAPPNSFGVG